MRAAIDAAGRLVVPKPLRDELGLTAGQELEIRAVDGRLEAEVVPTPVRMVDGKHGPVLTTDREMPPLTADMVRDVLERVRR